MPWIISGILLIIIIILITNKSKQLAINRSEANSYKQELEQLKNQKQDLLKDIHEQTNLIDSYQKKILEIQDRYKKELNKKSSDLDAYFASQKQIRQSEMDTSFENLWREKEENLNNKYIQFERDELEREHKFKQEVQSVIDAAKESQENILTETRAQQERFEGLLAPLETI